MPHVVINRLLCIDPQEDRNERGGANGDEVFLTSRLTGARGDQTQCRTMECLQARKLTL
jgi:hypothetical protein